MFANAAIVGHAQVQDGDSRQLALRTNRIVNATVPRGASGRISLRVTYRGPLIAPIARGARVADLEIRYPGGDSGTVPLFAAEAVGKAGPIDRIINGLAGLFS